MTEKDEMVALSIKQYWLYAITDLGKDIENRTWKPPQRAIGTRIALHASQQVDHGNAERVRALGGLSRISFNEGIRHTATGAIVATAKLEGYCTQSSSRWFSGPIGWILSDVRKLEEPIPCKGQLGLWTVPDDIVEMIND